MKLSDQNLLEFRMELEELITRREAMIAQNLCSHSHHFEPTRCYDCGRFYGAEHGFPDLIIPDQTWDIISPTKNGGGLLCPSCICQHLYEAGIEECPSTFMSGPLYLPGNRRP